MKRAILLGACIFLILLSSEAVAHDRYPASNPENFDSYWPFDGDSTDLVGTSDARDGLIDGWTDTPPYGMTGNVAYVDGTVGHSINLTWGRTEMTTEDTWMFKGWFNCTDASFDNGDEIVTARGNSGAGLRPNYLIKKDGAAGYKFMIMDTSDVLDQIAGDSADDFPICVGTWTMLTLIVNVSDDPTNGMWVYINTTLMDKSVTDNNIADESLDGDFHLYGRKLYDQGFDGEVAEVGVKMGVFDYSDVVTNYNAAFGGGSAEDINVTIFAPTENDRIGIDNLLEYNNRIYINVTHDNTSTTTCGINSTDFTSLGAAAPYNATWVNNTPLSGYYDLLVFCNKTGTNNGTDSVRFMVDGFSPIADSNVSGYITNDLYLQVNATDSYLDNVSINSSCWFHSYNSSPTQNYEYLETLDIVNCSTGEKWINITACDEGGNCILQNYSFMAMSRLRISADDIYNQTIFNFSILKNSTLEGSTTDGVFNLDNLTTGDYNVTIDATGYEYKSHTVAISGAYQVHNFTLYTTNSIQFHFFDEADKTYVENVSFELISSIFANNYSTANGSIYVDMLSPAEYTIRYNADLYQERFYYLTLINRSFNNLTLYLTNATEVTATVYDEINNLVEDAYIKVMRYDIDANSYVLREIAKTNFEGETKLHLTLNSAFYQFIIEYPMGTPKKTTSPTYIYETSLTFQIDIGEDVAEQYFNSQDISYVLSYNNMTNNIRFTYSDSNNLVNQGCLYVYSITLNKKTLINSSCVESTASTILLAIDNSSGSYRADALVFYGDDDQFIDSLLLSFDTETETGSFGLFGVILLTILFFTMGFWDKALGLILTPVPLFIGSIINIVDISVGVSLSIWIVCVIIAIVISRH